MANTRVDPVDLIHSAPSKQQSALDQASNSAAGPQDSVAKRRRFLQSGGALLGLAAASTATVASASDALEKAAPDSLPAIPDSMKSPGTPIGVQPYGTPSPFESGVARNVATNQTQYWSSTSRSPLAELDGIITPSGLFYERHHAGVPNIDPAKHRLMVHGLVRRPLVFSLDDLRRFPSVSRIHFLECSGNPVYKRPFGKTASDLVGLVSCAEWTGVTLKTVLEEAGLEPEGKWVVAEGADGAGMTRSIPIEKCLEDALLVYSQNGERLRPEQGYPVRLFLPGFEGNMSVKWLRRLKVADAPVYSREETAKYTDLLPSGRARQFTFYMEAKSIITSPSGGQRIASPGFVEIRGIAWSGHGKVARVEVSVDGGNSWAEAVLQEPVLTRALTRFRFAWHWNGELTTIQSRATDETGYVQPSFADLLDVRGDNSYYHNNAVQPWRIAPDGSVTNANV